MVRWSRRQKISYSNNRCREFFKVFLPDHSSTQLTIPPAFVKHITGPLPRKSILMNSTRKAWSLNLKKLGDAVIFEEGWQTFAEDNCLEFGDFLVFKYDGSSSFSVKIYGSNSCEKRERESSKLGERSAKFRKENVGNGDLNGSVHRSEAERNDRTLKENCKFSSKYPQFKVVMTPSYVKRGTLNIPMSFAKEHVILREEFMKEDPQTITIRNSNGSWPVSMSTFGGRSCKFSRGWLAFARENALREGDVCVFELPVRDAPLLDVSIIRGGLG